MPKTIRTQSSPSCSRAANGADVSEVCAKGHSQSSKTFIQSTGSDIAQLYETSESCMELITVTGYCLRLHFFAEVALRLPLR